MGMSASQARLLSLQARQSNLEYQGQQINQERTILSQQATALYNSLLSMTVPTPPATTDFQTIQYSGKLGATEYTFDANSVKPDGDFYSVTMQEKKHGDSLQQNATIALVDKNSKGSFKGIELDPTKVSLSPNEEVPTGNYVQDTQGSQYMVPITLTDNGDGTYSFPSQGGTYYTKSGNKFSQNSSGTPVDGLTYYALTTSASGTTGAVQVKAETTTIGGGSTTAANYITRSDMANIWVEENGQVRKAELSDFETDSSQPNILKLKSGVKYIQQSDAANAKTYSVKGDIDGVTVGDKGVHRLTEEEKQTYGDAIANSGLQDAQGNPYDADDFYMYYLSLIHI